MENQTQTKTPVTKGKTWRKKRRYSRINLPHDITDLVDKKIDLFEQEGKNEYFYQEQAKLIEERLENQKVTTKDIEYGKIFIEAVERKRSKSPNGKCYFDMHLIDNLPLPKKPKLVFYYGAKNIGKTYAQSVYFTERLTENPHSQIMMVRTTKAEIDHGLKNQLLGEEGPFELVTSTRTLRRKPGRLLERGEGTKTKGRKVTTKQAHELKLEPGMTIPTNAGEYADICGGATYATNTGFRAFQGSGWKNLTDLVGDEFNDVGNAKEGLSEEMFKRFLVFILSLERNNKNLRIWLFGNLLRHDSGVATNIALDMFRIPYDCNLKYGEFANGTPALYINLGQAGELFNSVEEQQFTDMFGEQASKDLYTNMPEATSLKVLNMVAFCKAEPIFSFIVEDEEKYFILYLARIKTSSKGNYYIMHIEGYSPVCHYPGFYPITDSVEIFNQFGALTYKRSKRVAKMVKKLRKMQKNQRIFFTRDDVRHHYCTRLAKRLVMQYKKELDGKI